MYDQINKTIEQLRALSALDVSRATKNQSLKLIELLLSELQYLEELEQE